MFQYRVKNGYSQERMAEKLDISARAYWDQENGKSGFSGQTICKFLSLLSEEEVLEIIRGLRKEIWGEEG